jgi:ABC-type multidrug transport system fused ATPase/permease subunit
VTGLPRSFYGRLYARPLLAHVALVVARQARLVFRSRAMLLAHLLQALVLGVALGLLFWRPSLVMFTLKISVVLFMSFALAFANMPEVALAVESRRVVLKHAEQRLYPPAAQVLAATLVHAPLAAAEVVVMGSLVYWLMGFCASAGRFLFFELALLAASLQFAALFRLLAYALPSAEVAQAAAAAVTGAFMLTSGFLVTRLNIPNWLLWFYYISPISWLLRSTSSSEFLAPAAEGCSQYSDEIPGYQGTGLTFGITFMNTYEMQLGDAWRWGGVAYLLALGALLVLLSALALAPDVRRAATATFEFCCCCCVCGGGGAGRGGVRGGGRGSARVPWLSPSPLRREEAVAMAAAVSVAGAPAAAPAAASSPRAVATVSPLGVELEARGNGAVGATSGASNPAVAANGAAAAASAEAASAAALVTAPIDLAWLDLRYSVSVSAPATTSAGGGGAGGGAQTVQRELLAGVTGIARAGELTAIIGRSGAGKTTLLDVLAGLKTQGKLSGAVFLGGARVASPADVARVAGYVQQDDVHLATATVRETLLFSAALRLPAAVSARALRLRRAGAARPRA